MTYSHCIIGAGIVGLATAYAITQRDPRARILMLEREDQVAVHQTGHNSGVIHSGIYYAPGSLKAELCRKGAEATTAFAKANNIAHDICGKLIVATNATEKARLATLENRAGANGITADRLNAAELTALEPNIQGVAALLIPATGIVDYKALSRALMRRLIDAGVTIVFNADVAAIAESADAVTISTRDGRSWTADLLIACAGLQSDRVAKKAGLTLAERIVPFRGEYFRLNPRLNALVKHLIYPVPDPEMPFLGIHITRMIDGSITVGPNAVLSMSRSSYTKGAVSIGDIASYAAFPGFWRMAMAHAKSGLVEMRNSIHKTGYLRECQKYCPSLTASDLEDGHAGIRAQAVAADGTLIHDFLFRQTGRTLHVINAPSPAATAALPIGEMIVEKLGELGRP